MSSAVGLAQALELLVDHHRADAVVREHLQQQRAVDRERQDVASARRRLAGLARSAAGRTRCRSAAAAAAARPAAARRRPAAARCRSGRLVSGPVGVIADAGHLGHEDQLVGLQRDRVLVATSSIVRLKASPVGEKPNGDSSTIAPMSSARADAGRVDLAHQRRVCLKSTPSTTPTGRAVMKLPEIDAHGGAGHRRVGQALAENAASIS